MVKKIVWTETSVRDRYRIYKFWLLHNQSDTYSQKLEKLFNETAKLIANFPEIGVQTDLDQVRFKVVRNFKMFYRINQDVVEIIRVWDTRQNPDDLTL